MKDLRESFFAVQAVCPNLHEKDVRDNFPTEQAVCSKFTRARFA